MAQRARYKPDCGAAAVAFGVAASELKPDALARHMGIPAETNTIRARVDHLAVDGIQHATGYPHGEGREERTARRILFLGAQLARSGPCVFSPWRGRAEVMLSSHLQRARLAHTWQPKPSVARIRAKSEARNG